MCRNTETQVSREAKEPILPLVQCRSARRATSDTRTPQLRGHAPRLTPSTAAVVPAVVAFRVIVMLVCPLTDPAARASSRTADAMGAWPGGAERRVSARSGGSGLHTVCPARAQVGGPSLTQQRASSAASRALPHLHLGTSRSVLTRNAKAAAVNGAALPTWQPTLASIFWTQCGTKSCWPCLATAATCLWTQPPGGGRLATRSPALWSRLTYLWRPRRGRR